MKLEAPNMNRIDTRAPGGALNIEMQLPPGMQIPENVMRPAAPPNPQPMQNQIRDLIQRLRGQTPNQVAPAPEPPQPGMMRSVLRRDQ
jgi:hypothetical protein